MKQKTEKEHQISGEDTVLKFECAFEGVCTTPSRDSKCDWMHESTSRQKSWLEMQRRERVRNMLQKRMKPPLGMRQSDSNQRLRKEPQWTNRVMENRGLRYLQTPKMWSENEVIWNKLHEGGYGIIIFLLIPRIVLHQVGRWVCRWRIWGCRIQVTLQFDCTYSVFHAYVRSYIYMIVVYLLIYF